MKNLWYFLNFITRINTTKKKLVDKKIIKLDFKVSNSKKYKLKVIGDSTIYIKKLKMSYLLKHYHLFYPKNYLKEKNT